MAGGVTAGGTAEAAGGTGATTPLLAGVRVLNLASVGPAARAGRWLADYGAEVINVGAVPSRGAVQITPVFHAYSGHRGMRRILLDLKSDHGRETFLRMAERADVVIESFRPGVTDRLGIGFETVRGRNPKIVYCSTTGFGQSGPCSQWAGHDLDYLAVSGYLAVGEPGARGNPALPGATLADSAGGGMHAVIAILAALVKGEGAYLDVSVADGVLSLMSLAVDEYLATGSEPGYQHSMTSGRYACYRTYQTGDGRWLAVAAIEPKFWANFCRLLGLEKWAAHQTDDAVQDQIRADVEAVLASKERDVWIGILSGSDTCVAPVLTVSELCEDAQYQARGAFAEAVHPEHGDLRQTAPLLAGMARPELPYRLPSGTHSHRLLLEAGFTEAEIKELLEEGTVA
ncbi:CaiB/BaiF CoA transferase family protein [Catenulispora pinistramenti]|uniref:CaiB/BaiF CoA transferase family protein n=1 Tax=Catenulispora pinistramenti TaxID=2705254 RepID=UPI0027DB17AE|nr:CaiB/BaiF CoA-transferase family protein [Catenulispora pinistramenti]